jgi:hypothetical protein
VIGGAAEVAPGLGDVVVEFQREPDHVDWPVLPGLLAGWRLFTRHLTPGVCAIAHIDLYSAVNLRDDRRCDDRTDLGCAGGAMATRADPRKNHLLAALPPEELARWLPKLEAVDMSLGQVLNESGMKTTHVYFPTTAIVSLL